MGELGDILSPIERDFNTLGDPPLQRPVRLHAPHSTGQSKHKKRTQEKLRTALPSKLLNALVIPRSCRTLEIARGMEQTIRYMTNTARIQGSCDWTRGDAIELDADAWMHPTCQKACLTVS